MATLDRELIPESRHGNTITDKIDFEEALSFASCLLENKDFTLKAQQRVCEAHVGWQGRVHAPTNWLWQIYYL